MKESKFSTWTFVILLIISTILVTHLLIGFFTPVVMSLVIVSIFNPLHKIIVRSLAKRDNFAAAISTLIVFLGVLIPLAFFIASLTQQALSLYQATQKLKSSGGLSNWMGALKSYLQRFTEYLSSYGIDVAPEPIIKLATSISQAVGRTLYESIGMIASNIMSLSFNIVLTVVLVFIFFVSGRAAKKFVMDLVPIPTEEKERLLDRFKELASAIFLGNGLISVIEGAIGGLLLYLFGVPGALIWAVVMTVAAFLPVVGATIVVVPATIYLFLVGDTTNALLFAVFNSIQLTLLETFLKPRIIGTKSQMHAVLVFLSIISGVQIYGVFGLFYGPLLVTMFLSLAQIYKEHYRDILLKKGP